MRTKGKPVTHGYDEQESFSKRKREAKKVIRDFCLPHDISKELQIRVDNAQSFAEVNRILKEARGYL